MDARVDRRSLSLFFLGVLILDDLIENFLGDVGDLVDHDGIGRGGLGVFRADMEERDESLIDAGDKGNHDGVFYENIKNNLW